MGAETIKVCLNSIARQGTRMLGLGLRGWRWGEIRECSWLWFWIQSPITNVTRSRLVRSCSLLLRLFLAALKLSGSEVRNSPHVLSVLIPVHGVQNGCSRITYWHCSSSPPLYKGDPGFIISILKNGEMCPKQSWINDTNFQRWFGWM